MKTIIVTTFIAITILSGCNAVTPVSTQQSTVRDYLPSISRYNEQVGVVTEVKDGDTIAAIINGKKVDIRLAEIDAPEKSQAFGNESKQSLASMLLGKNIRIKQTDTDRYKRVVARVYTDNLDVNAEQISRGMAWAYLDYLTDETLPQLEFEAKTAKRGLWASINPIPPWEFRRGTGSTPVINKTSASKTQKVSSENYQCGQKKTCGQMSSCKEAMFYLNQCGVTKLDSNGDGMPCESLCK